jgi:hypothetical protein
LLKSDKYQKYKGGDPMRNFINLLNEDVAPPADVAAPKAIGKWVRSKYKGFKVGGNQMAALVADGSQFLAGSGVFILFTATKTAGNDSFAEAYSVSVDLVLAKNENDQFRGHYAELTNGSSFTGAQCASQAISYAEQIIATPNYRKDVVAAAVAKLSQTLGQPAPAPTV